MSKTIRFTLIPFAGALVSSLFVAVTVFAQGTVGTAANDEFTVTQKQAVSEEIAGATQNHLQIINHGVAAFQKRLEMIENAHHRIDVEYFIYNTDEAGRLFTHALVKKAAEGVKVRILIDASITVLQLKKNFISQFPKKNIEVKYYNSVPLVEFMKAQYRDHRKLLLVDGTEAITGSRNIADEYFDLNQTFNFRDRDIAVKGPLVTQMASSFESYWKDPRSINAPRMNRAEEFLLPSKSIDAEDFFTESEYDRFMLGEIKRVGEPILADTRAQGDCAKTTYVTDDPGVQSHATRKVFPYLMNRIGNMNEGDKLYLESPYFIIKDKSVEQQMTELAQKNVSAVLLTNSLASTDAFYVAANFMPKASFYESISDSQMYIYSGDTPKNISFVNDEKGRHLTRKATWGIHSKTFVFGNDAFAIGTFNVDPRSAYLNSEMLVFCEGNSDLASYVASDIETRKAQSDLIDANGKLSNGKSMFSGVSFFKRVKFYFSIYPSQWFAYLL